MTQLGISVLTPGVFLSPSSFYLDQLGAVAFSNAQFVAFPITGVRLAATLSGSFSTASGSLQGTITGYALNSSSTEFALIVTGIPNMSYATFIEYVAQKKAADILSLWMANGVTFSGNSLPTAVTDITTGPGDDLISGGGGSNLIDAGSGNDTVYGSDAIDTIFSRTGNDNISGGAGDDLLLGGDGNDIIAGDAGSDSLYGEGGDDRLRGGTGNDVIDGGDGIDTAVYSGSRASYIIAAVAAGFTVTSAAEGSDTLSAMEFAQFSDQTLALSTPDITAPTVSSFSPLDEATGVAIASNIVVTFSEAITKGTGSILLKTAAGVTVATYDAATSSNLSVSGSTLSINPTADLGNITDYKVEFAAGSIKDLAGNSYAGTTSYNFTTVPALYDSTDVGVSSNILIKFGEAITRGTGSIVLKTAAGVTVASYDAATSSNLNTNFISPNYLVIDPTADLNYDTVYIVEFTAGSIKAATGNGNVVTANYNFRTVAAAGGQTFTGTSSNDTFVSGSGNDSVYGGLGTDTVVLSGTHASYDLKQLFIGWTARSEAGDLDTLMLVERLHFADKKFALDLDPAEPAGQALMFIGLMAPTLVTTPSVVGTILGVFDQGKSMVEVCQLALDIGLVSSIAGSNSNSALAAMAFRNVAGSEANADTLKMLVGFMDGTAASFTQAGFMAAIAGLELNQSHIGLVGLQQTGVEYV